MPVIRPPLDPLCQRQLIPKLATIDPGQIWINPDTGNQWEIVRVDRPRGYIALKRHDIPRDNWDYGLVYHWAVESLVGFQRISGKQTV